MRIKLIFLLLLLLTAGTAVAQHVKCFILSAPEKSFYNIKKIGVLEVNCDNNRRMNKTVTDLLIADLVDQHRGIYNEGSKYWGLKKGEEGQTFVKGVNTDFYQIIEREQLEKILREQRLSLSGAIDEGSAAEVGRLLGLDVIIMSNVNYNSIDERGTSLLNLASSSGSNCLKRIVTVKGTMKMVSVETAQIIGTKSADYTASIQKCDDQRSGIPRPEAMAEICFKNLVHQFVDYFAPGYKYIEYDLEKIQLKEFRKQSKEAFSLIEIGDLDRAFPIIYAMFEADSYNPKAAYNLGVLYEIVGSYEDALEYYSIAYDLDYSEGKYAEAVKRSKDGVGLNTYLDEIGRPVETYSFTSTDPSTALAEKVRLKGNGGDRVVAYEFPDKSSNIVAKIPGGLEFKVIGKSGAFYKVQLRGTKTAYIHKSNIK